MRQKNNRSSANSGQNRPARRSHGQRGRTADKLYLYGSHTVRAALANPKRKNIKLFATENTLARLKQEGIDTSSAKVELTQPNNFAKLVGSEAVHQGLVLECEPLDSLDSSELFHLVDEPVILALDQVTDPHNVGAILRSAVAMGIKTVLVTSRNSAAETAVLAKSASGALDLIKIVHLKNFAKGLEEMNEMGFATIGLDSEGPLVLEDTVLQNAKKSICLVLGAEGKGLREKSRETCTALARLDMAGPIKSLNVSNAAALSLYIVTNNKPEK